MIPGSFTIVRVNRGEYSAYAEVTTPNAKENQQFVVGWAVNEKVDDQQIVEKVRSVAAMLKIYPGIIYMAR